jgi:hypothetical protein
MWNCAAVLDAAKQCTRQPAGAETVAWIEAQPPAEDDGGDSTDESKD